MCKLCIDADALNIISEHRELLDMIPEGAIMTPHPKEMDRLSGKDAEDGEERLANAIALAQRINGYVILKGHNSRLCLPNGDVIVNTTGNSGMATAGSGDVLTGIITALLARGYAPQDAASVGMYLHGLAGDIAADEVGKESLIASDIIRNIGKAFKRLATS